MQLRTVHNRKPALSPRQGALRPRLAERRRRRRILSAFLFALFALPLFGALAALSHYERFVIGAIEVSGVEKLSPEDMRSTAGRVLDDGLFHLFARRNIFLYPKEHISAEVRAAFPRVKDVSLSRDSLFGKTLRIRVEERQAFARWCSAECFLMDKDGFLFAHAEGLTESGYVFGGGLDESKTPVRQTFLYGHLQESLRLLSLLEKEGYAPRGLVVESEQDFSVVFVDGMTMLATFDESEDVLVRRLALALSSDALRGREMDIEYVDLRFGNKLFYKMKEKE